MKAKNPVILVVADGWGIAPPGRGNFISQAKTRFFSGLLAQYPNSRNDASGNAVGLPQGAQGNSEVGHLHMGAGRIVWQMYELINRSIMDGSFRENSALVRAMKQVKKKGTLHLMGLCSDEGVHAHINHLTTLIEMASGAGLKDVAIHFFADGRDVAEKSAMKYVETIAGACRSMGTGRIASIVGRYYSMDRDGNWDRTRQAYEMLTEGRGFTAKNAKEAVEAAYARGDRTDYYIQPTIVGEPALIKDGDSVLFFNFRTDRPRQLTMAFTQKDFSGFRRNIVPKVLYTTVSEYDKSYGLPFAFAEERVKNNLGEILSKKGLRQLRVAETEKYAHVTYFFNSQIEKPCKGEERMMVSSPKVPSYDEKPEMSAAEVAEKTSAKIREKSYDFILVNFANCDLVGHSAVKEAIIRAVEVVDACVGKVVETGLASGYTVIVTSDHGSAEDKLYPDGKPKPAHSCNPVPFIVASNDPKLKAVKLKNGGQKDVAPTILDIMGLKKPKEMTGKTLIS
jgi:2,3-bisphosphoglycerate-independent phosphoglycerate mutase